MSWSADAASAGPRDRGAELARELRDRRDLRQRQGLADARAGLALQRFELGIGRDQPAGLVDAAEDRRAVQRER